MSIQGQLERGAADNVTSAENMARVSIAISLKRIADALCNPNGPDIAVSAHTHCNLTNLAWEMGSAFKRGMEHG